MRKFLLVLVLIVIAGGAFVALAPKHQAQTPLSLLLNGDTRKLAQQSQKFLEDIKFKDFKSAALHSSPEDRTTADIPKLIERLFQVKPEFLEINQVQVLSADLDSSRQRGRVKLQADVKLLNTSELRKPEIMLYWKKAPTGQWYMDLASSLQ
jgi:hypothetical protein